MKPKSYRKKPVEVQAIRWDGEHETLEHITHWNPAVSMAYDGVLYVPTLEGTMICSLGNWIIRGVRGEIYPCDREIFQMTYDEIGKMNGCW